MLTIKDYIKVRTIEEAYDLNQNRSNLVLGGMLWLKMQDRNVHIAIDMSDLGLNTIEETEDSYVIGAMVTLRQLENSKELDDLTKGAIKESLRHIVGVQFRNLATVGGSVYGRFGFSDVLTVLMALDAKVKLYKGGTITIEQFARMRPDNDILEAVIIPKKPLKIKYMSIRNTQTDFPVLTCCASEIDGTYRVVIGARPARAVCFYDNDGILNDGVTEESVNKYAEYILNNIKTEDNNRASADYRRKMAGVLTKRTLIAMTNGGVE